MRAIAFQEFGAPDVLTVIERPIQVPGDGQVVVRVAASTVNPTDLLMRSGEQASIMTNLKPPYIAGMEFSGRVHALGGDVADLQVGQAVMGIVNPRRPEGGAHAEYVAIPAASLVPIPTWIGMAAAATIPMNGMTARMVLELSRLPLGASVLVTGGAGAVGGYVIPLAKRAGLRVIADAKDEDRDLILGFGAEYVVPRGEGMSAAVRALFPLGVDGLVDAALLGNPAAALVRDGGVAIALRKADMSTDSRLTNLAVGVLNEATNTDGLRWIADRFKEGILVPRVAATFPVERAAQAHTLVEQGGLRGRVVLTFS